MEKIILQLRKRVSRLDGSFALRITYRKAHRKGSHFIKADRYLVKCGCCAESLEIHCPGNNKLEINGVNGSIKNWREILLPLLQFNMRDDEIIDVSPSAQAAREQLEILRKNYAATSLFRD